MEDQLMAELVMHVDACSVCSAAKKRVNDFCETGRLLFFEWAKTNGPLRAEEVEITKEQYDRLVTEQKLRRRQAQDN